MLPSTPVSAKGGGEPTAVRPRTTWGACLHPIARGSTPWCRPDLWPDLPEMSDPRSTLRSMAEIVQLGAWRERKQAERSAPEVERLERAIARLDGILERVTGQKPAADSRLETDMLAISGAISAGMVDRAAVLAEELARRLENRAARQG